MKRVLLNLLVLVAGVSFIFPQNVSAYNFGDFRSMTLTVKAWKALGEKDLDAVIAYTDKCLELYAEEAASMQASLTDYVLGDKEEVFAYWALNDVATILFIQGEAYRQAGMMEEAKASYQKLIAEFTYGQCWDTGGWFWKPDEAAKAKIKMIASGSTVDFGDYKSATLIAKAWQALADEDLDSVLTYADKCRELYGEEAKKQQGNLLDYVTGTNGDVFANWALNDVATCLFIEGEMYRQVNMEDEAKVVYQKLINEYTYGQCWDPSGWFWKPAEAAEAKISMMETGSAIDFGDYKSSRLTSKAWEALANKDFESVYVYVDKCLELYGEEARKMQNSLTEYPWETQEEISSYWALNDVGTCLFVKAVALEEDGDLAGAKKVYKKLIDEFYFAQTWDVDGWFWKPSAAAEEKLDELAGK